jgi:hypothetical protein
LEPSNASHTTVFQCFKDSIIDSTTIFAHFVVLAELSKRLSGVEIRNICLNAIHAGSTAPDPAK